jgi:hypothetical protein
MNLYESFLGISSTQKKDFKTYHLQVDQERYLEGQQNHKWRNKEKLCQCKDVITLLIIKSSIPVWGKLKVLIDNCSIAGSWVITFLRPWGWILR